MTDSSTERRHKYGKCLNCGLTLVGSRGFIGTAATHAKTGKAQCADGRWATVTSPK